MHRYREKVRYRLMREHPEWSEGQIRRRYRRRWKSSGNPIRRVRKGRKVQTTIIR